MKNAIELFSSTPSLLKIGSGEIKKIYVGNKDVTSMYIGNTLVGHLGTYKSKERALEVLDEIEDLMRSLNSSDLKIIIYEMPKE